MIKKIEFIAATATSHPFGTAAKKCSLDEYGYEEKEYFMYGTANIYKRDQDNKPEILYPNAEYVNRFMVRSPINKENFSGNIVIEILNPTALIDIDRMWVLSYKQIIRNGDIYIGITSKPDVLNAMFEFNAKRYSPISWKSPLGPTEIIPSSNAMRLPIQRAEDETGLFWDMLTDLAKLLRTTEPNNPLNDYGCKKLILSGWSQSACYLIRYVNSFAYLPNVCEKGPIFDGYFAGGAVHILAIPLNQRDYFVEGSMTDTSVTHVKEPYVAVQTESENADLGTYEIYKDNCDIPGFLYRIYEVAGSSHDSKYSLLDYYSNDEDMDRIGRTPEYPGENKYPNDYPYEFSFSAAYRNLINWVVEGIAPPVAQRIPVTYNTENMKDVFGNTIGGVRTPLIDYPTCRYYSYSDYKNDKNKIFGHVEPFSKEFLIELYGSLGNYKQLVSDSTYAQVRKGFIVKEDAEALINIAVDTAMKRGLK